LKAELNVDTSALLAVEVKGNFEFEVVENDDNRGAQESDKEGIAATSSDPTSSDQVVPPFSLKDIDIAIPKGPYNETTLVEYIS
jgi:hypothetical protein